MTPDASTNSNSLVAVCFRQYFLTVLLFLFSASGLRAQAIKPLPMKGARSDVQGTEIGPADFGWSSHAQDVVTFHNNNARTGLNPAERILKPSNVQWSGFGLLFVLSLDGQVSAQPLYTSGVRFPDKTIHDVLIVATENDSAYGFDAVTGAQLWHTSVLNAGETASDDRNCDQIVPEIGVTSTPVIDRWSGPQGTVYLVAMSKDASGNYHQRLHALNLSTGAEEFGGPTEIQASYPGTGDNSSNGYVIFDPSQYKERTGLLLLNHEIYTGWASHCDVRPYTGWLIGYNEHTLAQTRVLNVTPNGSDGAIWQSGGGLTADSDGNIYFLDANGIFDTTLDAQGFPSEQDYGNAFIKVSTAGSALSVVDYFALWNTVSDSGGDVDLGSGGAMLLPDMVDAQGKTWQLAVGAGKDSNIYVVDRNNLGKFNPSTNNIYQQIDYVVFYGEWGAPVFFNGTLFYNGTNDYIKAFPFTNAVLSGVPSSSSVIRFEYPGATMSVSAEGTQDGILWAIEHTSPAVLHAYDATNLVNELYNSTQAPNGRDQFGNGHKFVPPTVSHGRVYAATSTGVGVFGLLPPANPAKRAGSGSSPKSVGVSTVAQKMHSTPAEDKRQ
jgi:hypothetical protein